jgi:bisanhydrobacterioruberin hydratase
VKTIERIKIFTLYFFLIAGGLWHVLNVFQTIMAWLAGPLLIGLAIWFSVEYGRTVDDNQDVATSRAKFVFWAIVVILFSFLAETVGVKTGLVFGSYTYGSTLWPQLFGVPLAIGFAWLLMLLCSIALMQRLPKIAQASPFIQIITIAILMTFFDRMMEPAAIKLGYWSWQGGSVPLQNYAAWFVISWLLARLGHYLGLLRKQMPTIVLHGYFAQMIYFLLIWMKPL